MTALYATACISKIMNISGNDIIQISIHPTRQCNKLQLKVHTEHKAIIIVSVASTVCCKVNSASTAVKSRRSGLQR